jgi:hypothetical protein
MKICLILLRCVVASGLVLAFAILHLPYAKAQENAASGDIPVNAIKIAQQAVIDSINLLEDSRKSLRTAQLSVEVAKRQYEGELRRNTAGLTSDAILLYRKDQIPVWEYKEFQALISYKQAVIALQREIYNLLDATEFSIAQEAP